MRFTVAKSTRDRVCESCKEVIPAGEVHRQSQGGCFYHSGHQPDADNPKYNSAGYVTEKENVDYWEGLRLNKDFKKQETHVRKYR